MLEKYGGEQGGKCPFCGSAARTTISGFIVLYRLILLLRYDQPVDSFSVEAFDSFFVFS